MNNLKSYKCLSVKLFDTWRITFYGFILLSLVIGLVVQNFKSGLVISGVIMLLVGLIHILSSYSVVTFNGDSIKLQNFSKVVHLNNLQSLKTWWCYDYGISSIELSEGTQGKSRSLTNKINCFAKFEGVNESIFIYEQIHMSGKFPNGHEYLQNEKVDKSKMIRVWDVDKCLAKLELIKN